MQHQQTNGGERAILQQRAPLTSQSGATPTRESEMPVCKYYVRGTCKHGVSGTNCQYRHPNLCRKLLTHGPVGQHGCTRGRKCQFLHPKLCRNSIRHHECLAENCKLHHIKGTKRIRNENFESPDRTRTTAGSVAAGVQKRTQGIVTDTGSQFRVHPVPLQAGAQHPSSPSPVVPPQKNTDANLSFFL